MKKLVLLTSLLAMFLLSCQSTDTKKDPTKKELTKSELIIKIQSFEQKLFGDSVAGINKKSAMVLVTNYQSFAARFPKDSLAPEYLFKASDILMNMGRPQQTVFTFNEIIQKYTDFNKLSTCYFLRAFVYDDQLKDYKAAEKYYKEFLDKYPDSDFADDAQMLLRNLGKTPEELINEFGGNN